MAPQPTNAINLMPIGTYQTGVFDKGAAEIASFDPNTNRLFVVNGNKDAIEVLDLSNPTNPTLLFSIDVTPFGAGANSVDVKDGKLAVAVEAEDGTANGMALFYQTNLSSGDRPLAEVEIGVLPDMITFTPNGEKVVVANEGEPIYDDAGNLVADPEGSVSVIDLPRSLVNIRVNLPGNLGEVGSDILTPAAVTSVGFTQFNDQQAALEAAGVRIYGPGGTVAQDLEPEYVAATNDTAWVTLQENNALAKVDLNQGRVEAIAPLGYKNYNQPGNGIDPSDEDGEIDIHQVPVLGMYQPDSIAPFTTGGETYLITANEGDSRDYPGFSEEVQVQDLTLDRTMFPNASELQRPENLGRLEVTNSRGDTDGDGAFEQLYSYGARSFSIWDANGNLVYDSGNSLETIVAEEFPNNFNADNDANNSFDTRSIAKGPEPEGIATGVISDRTYAFIGLERIGGVAIYDITNPVAPEFVQYTNNRNFEGNAEAGTAGDLGPEGLEFIPATDSPNGEPLLVVTHEVSGSTKISQIQVNKSQQMMMETQPNDGTTEAKTQTPVESGLFNPTWSWVGFLLLSLGAMVYRKWR